MKIVWKHDTIEKIIVWRLTMPRGRKKQNVLTLEEQLVTVNERIQEVENELKQLRSQRKEIQAKIEEQEKGNIVPGSSCFGKNRRRCSCNIKSPRSERRTVI